MLHTRLAGDVVGVEAQTGGTGTCDATTTRQTQVATVAVVHSTLVQLCVHCSTLNISSSKSMT